MRTKNQKKHVFFSIAFLILTLLFSGLLIFCEEPQTDGFVRFVVMFLIVVCLSAFIVFFAGASIVDGSLDRKDLLDGDILKVVGVLDPQEEGKTKIVALVFRKNKDQGEFLFIFSLLKDFESNTSLTNGSILKFNGKKLEKI